VQPLVDLNHSYSRHSLSAASIQCVGSSLQSYSIHEAQRHNMTEHTSCIWLCAAALAQADAQNVKQYRNLSISRREQAGGRTFSESRCLPYSTKIFHSRPGCKTSKPLVISIKAIFLGPGQASCLLGTHPSSAPQSDGSFRIQPL
jgi:hypothetical protein